MERYAVVAVRAVVVEGNSILLTRRGHPPFRGFWSFPGGRVARGEALREAVIREALEEAGVRVEPTRVIAIYDLHVTGHGGSTEHHFVLLDFEAKYLGGGVRPGGDAVEARFVELSEVEELKLTPATRATIELIREGRMGYGVAPVTIRVHAEPEGGECEAGHAPAIRRPWQNE